MVLVAWSIIGSTHALLPAFVQSANDRTSGICAPQAGFGQRTVRAHIQAITVASPPPSSGALDNYKGALTARIQPPQNIPAGSRVVGIDLTAGDNATGVALLNGCSVETCSLFSDEEILGYIRKHKPKIVSIVT